MTDATNTPPAEDHIPLQEREDSLVIRFGDKEGQRAEIVLYVGRAEEGDQWFKREGDTALAHGPTAPDAFFALCAEAVEAALTTVPEPPSAANHAQWQEALEAAIRKTVLPLRFDYTIAPVGAGDDDDLDALLDEILDGE